MIKILMDMIESGKNCGIHLYIRREGPGNTPHVVLTLEANIGEKKYGGEYHFAFLPPKDEFDRELMTLIKGITRGLCEEGALPREELERLRKFKAGVHEFLDRWGIDKCERDVCRMRARMAIVEKKLFNDDAIKRAEGATGVAESGIEMLKSSLPRKDKP